MKYRNNRRVSNAAYDTTRLNAEGEGESTMIPAIYVGLGVWPLSKVIVFTDKEKFLEIDEDIVNDINNIAHSRQISLSFISFHPSDTWASRVCIQCSQNVTCGPMTDILTQLIKIMNKEMISGNKTTKYLTTKHFYLETTHEQRDMSQVTENEMYLTTRQNETKFLPAICMELENISDISGQDSVKANFVWRFLVPPRFIQKTENPLQILISNLNEALGNLTNHDSKLIELLETLTQEMDTTAVFKDESKEMLWNLLQSLEKLEKYSDIIKAIQNSLKSSHSLENSIQLANSEIDKLKSLSTDLENAMVTLQKHIKENKESLLKVTDNRLLNMEKMFESSLKNSCLQADSEIDKLRKLASALNEGMLTLEKVGKENEERIIKKTEERLLAMEKKIECSLEKLQKLLLSSLTESSQAQLSSFMQFGSYNILADDEGDVATNTLKIDFSKITDKCKMTMAGIYSNVCDNFRCKAFYSHLDICTRIGLEYNWKCRFCYNIKSIPNIILHSPNDYDISYLHNTNMEDQNNIGDFKIVFLIDISGSMSSYCMGTLTSRLDAVKTAVINKIKQLINTCQKRRIGLVIYNETVTVYGTHYARIVNGDYNDMEYLLAQGRNYSDLQPLESKGSELITRLNGLHAQGEDALGPAILVGLGMMHSSRGSRMIICSDGGGNTGIGALGKYDAWAFYQQVIVQAKKNAVTISINSFHDCYLSMLEEMARETGGNVRRISPTDLFIHIEEDITRNVVATNAEIKIIMPQEMYVHASGSNDDTRSVVSVPVGNISDSNNHIFCFQFGFRKYFHINTGWEKSATGNFQIPIQVQVIYHDNDGKRVTRVFSTLRETTIHRDVVDLCMNAETIVTGLAQKAAKTLLQSQCSRIAHKQTTNEFIATAKEYKTMDKIRFRPELVCKLDMFILLLEKILEVGPTDEMSALLSKMVTIS